LTLRLSSKADEKQAKNAMPRRESRRQPQQTVVAEMG
jgi:hypothetical protein